MKEGERVCVCMCVCVRDMIITSFSFSPQKPMPASSQTRVWPILSQTQRWAPHQKKTWMSRLTEERKSHDDLIRVDLKDIKCKERKRIFASKIRPAFGWIKLRREAQARVLPELSSDTRMNWCRSINRRINWVGKRVSEQANIQTKLNELERS